MIRVAKEADLGIVFNMAKKFIATSAYADKCDDKTLMDLIVGTIKYPDGIVLLHGKKGMIAGRLAPYAFAPLLIAAELGWWVEPEHRKSKVGKELLEAFEYWAKQKNCKMVTMVSLDDEVGKIYERKGYHLAERVYMKELN